MKELGRLAAKYPGIDWLRIDDGGVFPCHQVEIFRGTDEPVENAFVIYDENTLAQMFPQKILKDLRLSGSTPVLLHPVTHDHNYCNPLPEFGVEAKPILKARKRTGEEQLQEQLKWVADAQRRLSTNSPKPIIIRSRRQRLSSADSGIFKPVSPEEKHYTTEPPRKKRAYARRKIQIADNVSVTSDKEHISDVQVEIKAPGDLLLNMDLTLNGSDGATSMTFINPAEDMLTLGDEAAAAAEFFAMFAIPGTEENNLDLDFVGDELISSPTNGIPCSVVTPEDMNWNLNVDAAFGGNSTPNEASLKVEAADELDSIMPEAFFGFRLLDANSNVIHDQDIKIGIPEIEDDNMTGSEVTQSMATVDNQNIMFSMKGDDVAEPSDVEQLTERSREEEIPLEFGTTLVGGTRRSHRTSKVPTKFKGYAVTIPGFQQNEFSSKGGKTNKNAKTEVSRPRNRRS